jgi:hypothetical protein
MLAPDHEPGSLVLGPAVSLVPSILKVLTHPAGDARASASGRLSLLLALEVAPIRRATADRHRAARIDPADEHGQSAVGCAAHSGELLKVGLEAAQSSVPKYMVKRRWPPSPGWRTFLGSHAPDIAAMDLFVVPTIDFDLLYAYADYYNRVGTHRSLDKDAPVDRLVQRTRVITSLATLGGLHHGLGFRYTGGRFAPLSSIGKSPVSQ